MPILIGVLACENAVEMLVQDNATAPEACSNCRRFMLMGSPPRVSRHSTRSERHYKNRAAHCAPLDQGQAGRTRCRAHRAGAHMLGCRTRTVRSSTGSGGLVLSTRYRASNPVRGRTG